MPDARELAQRRLRESLEVKQTLLEPAAVDRIVAVADLMTDALRAGRKVIFCGNGGSAADATHLAAELVGRFVLERAPLPALSLTDNVSSVTAIGNDYDYEQTFARQVRGLGQEGDVLVAISTSGSSANVLAAVRAASETGLRTAGFTGAAGGRLAELVEVCLQVPSESTAHIQEGYMMAGHVMCEIVERRLFA
jgi:D-sedoheptulose 7-phosphate isomerase